MSEGKHKHHERVVHTHRTHVNNLNLSGFRGHSVSHAGRASKLKVLEQSGETVAVAVYLAQGERLLEEEVVDKDPITDISPPPPSTFEALTEGIGYDNPIVVQVPIPAGKTVHDLTVIDVLINMLDMQVGSYTFTDIITDSVHKFFEAMVISDGTDTNRYPDVLAETDENELQGYFGFQYNEETGYLSGGKFQSFGAMYFRGKPNPLTVAPPVHSDDNDPIHGLGYPDLPPGQYPIDWLPYDEDTEGNKTYYFTLSFEEMELEFTIARETDANGVVTDKHKIIYRNRIKEKKAA